jgi:hypothetical protein
MMHPVHGYRARILKNQGRTGRCALRRECGGDGDMIDIRARRAYNVFWVILGST